MSTPMLRTQDLTKVFGALTAVDHLSIEVYPGDIMGFIGPNGAGKTTTIKMVAGLIEATAGAAYVNGIDVAEYPEDARQLLGYMPDFYGLYDELRVWEYLDFFAAAYRIPRPKRAGLIRDVLELTDLSIKHDSFVGELSRGMQQRLCLAKTLLHDPQLLLLDEPAAGLDPRARIEIKELLKELRKMGKTILVSSHILPELADFCNKVTIIEQGKLVVTGDVATIVAQCRSGLVLKIRLAEGLQEAAFFLQACDGCASPVVDDGEMTVTYTGKPGEQHLVLSALVAQGFKVLSFTEEALDLEDVFMKVTEGVVI
jgi:ABC-2 type transport system ATP-binding protein